jgi:serine O-acetyltransferase
MNRPPHEAAAATLRSAYDKGPGINDADTAPLPDRASVDRACRLALSLLFPGYFDPEPVTRAQLDAWLLVQLGALERLLDDAVVRALRYAARAAGSAEPADCPRRARDLVRELLGDLAAVRGLAATDVEAAWHNDPAAVDRGTIVTAYPCIEALAVQRFAHCMYRRGIPVLPRIMTEIAHGRTGIDIHPGASLGESFFIDHGTGVVIGETCTVGKHCVLYQGVGLIAWNPLARNTQGELTRGQANKRHPDLQDHVTVYAGASILGGDTVIGHHSVIGGNVWLTHSVEPHSVVTNKDPELLIRKRKAH